ncbi:MULTISPECIES: DUF4136 domain-containing protein [Persicobacter]|uniref:DUF4136 domain-containing protein n=1 Tax=Persicobacter diffluens TaxID=981 RepID=A0AAN4W0A6_9BACT|nr:DUF4136 domain-containing protein [Persicobacter sp. CCB-QB2]GJM61580.1 hypothetical protein PEDI_21320 [Persicobacter diffluens]
MKNWQNLFFVLIAALTFSACSSVNVSYDYDRGADFSSYQTYSFMIKDPDQKINVGLNELMIRRVMSNIGGEMSARSYEEVENNPDLLINFYLKTKDKKNVYYDPYWGGWYGPWGPYRGPQVTEYTEGNLVIDIVDAKKKQLIWQGVATGSIDGKMKNPDKTMQKIVNEVFLRYPHKANEAFGYQVKK